MTRNQDISVSKAKQAISSYRKAVGDPAKLAELMVFYCERAAGFCDRVRIVSHAFGYRVGDEMDSPLEKYACDSPIRVGTLISARSVPAWLNFPG